MNSASSAPRVAVIGGGIRGSMFAAITAQHDRASLVTLCDPATDVRARLSQRFDVAVHSDVDTMLDAHPDLTAAIVATPDFAHRDPALACIARGLDLLIEKPLATNADDADTIRLAAAQAGVRVVVGFENRWNQKFVEVRDQLVGQPVVNQVVHLNDTRFVPTQMLSWAAQSSPAWFLMPHSLDLTVWLSGATPTEVFARGSRKILPRLGIETWDSITASFAMSDGSTVSLDSQWVLPESAPSVFDFRHEVHTDTSSFHLDIAHDGVTRYDPDGVSWPQFGVYTRRGRLRGVPVDMATDFLDVLSGDSVPDLPGADQGCLITTAIEAVHRSLDTGLPQPL